MVGYKTALMDNPRLNVRHWAGTNPVRVVTDRYLQLPAQLHLLDNSQSTIVVNYDRETEIPAEPERYAAPSTAYLKIEREHGEIAQLLAGLHRRKIQSVLVEGGAAVINAFLESGLWDEIRRCQGELAIGSGVELPPVTTISTSACDGVSPARTSNSSSCSVEEPCGVDGIPASVPTPIGTPASNSTFTLCSAWPNLATLWR